MLQQEMVCFFLADLYKSSVASTDLNRSVKGKIRCRMCAYREKQIEKGILTMQSSLLGPVAPTTDKRWITKCEGRWKE